LKTLTVHLGESNLDEITCSKFIQTVYQCSSRWLFEWLAWNLDFQMFVSVSKMIQDKVWKVFELLIIPKIWKPLICRVWKMLSYDNRQVRYVEQLTTLYRIRSARSEFVVNVRFHLMSATNNWGKRSLCHPLNGIRSMWISDEDYVMAVQLCAKFGIDINESIFELL
jgi:hypothetical protein